MIPFPKTNLTSSQVTEVISTLSHLNVDSPSANPSFHFCVADGVYKSGKPVYDLTVRELLTIISEADSFVNSEGGES